MLKAASSNGLTIAPRPKLPKSPPLTAEPGSCEFLTAKASKLFGFFLISAKIPSALAFAACFASGLALTPKPIKIWLAALCSLPLNLAEFSS